MALNDGKPSILFAVPSTLGDECVELGRWLWSCAIWLGKSDVADKLAHCSQRSARILLNRNSFIEHAIKGRFDYLLMVDPDMVPDLYCSPTFNRDGDESEWHPPVLARQKPFLPTALEIFREHPFSVVAAPACGEPPKRTLNVYPLDAPNHEEPKPATHEYAEKRAREGAVEQVAAIGTGLIMIPLPVLFALKRPFFDDTYNADKTALKLSQDIYFTNTLHQAGVSVFCAWCSFAGHQKTVTVGCPGIDELWATKPGKDAGWVPPVSL
ncbi:MAG: hypothetical protein KGL39_28115 [Patescibacteria group bacterium]|nr:hypothetical protein [Patescibacteria group bacterium]